MRTRRRTALLAVATTWLSLLVAVVGTATPAAAADPTPDAQNAVSWAAANGYRSAITVLDTSNGQMWTAGDVDAMYVTESLVKLFIATRLLVQGQMSGFNDTTAYKMITQSDDASANALYGRVGGDGVLPWVAAHYGIPNLGGPPPSPGYWGATRITARGLALFYNAVRWDPAVWPWLSNAMHHATPYGSDGFYQFFGIPQATSDFGLKQGWGSDTPSGVPEQNSTGTVEGDRFAVVILTQGPGYGGALSNAVSTEARLLMPGGLIAADRFSVVDASRRAQAKDGTVNSGWTAMLDNARQVAMAGTRYGVVTTNGMFMLKDGSLVTSPWTLVADHATAVALTGARIAVLRDNGDVLVKEGAVNADWVLLAQGVQQVVVDGARIGVLGTDGTLRVKEGAVTAPWTTVATGVQKAALWAYRIGVLRADGSVNVKDGALNADWVLERTDARDLAVTRDRVAVMTRDNTVVAKQGSLYADWLTVAVNVESMTVQDNRVGVHGFDNVVLVKEGFLSAPWVTLYNPALAVVFG